MSRLLTRLPRAIAPVAPFRAAVSARNIVTDLDTGGTRKAKQTSGKGFISVGQDSQGGMPTMDKGDEAIPPQSRTSTGHTILPSLKQTVQQTIEHPEEWEGIHAERIASRSAQGAQSEDPKAVAHPEEWEGIRASADASDGWEAGRAGRDVTEAWGSEMAQEALSGREAVSSRMMGRDTAHTSEFPAGIFGEPRETRRAMGDIRSGTSGGRSESGSGIHHGKEEKMESNSPDYASPMNSHISQNLGQATIPIDATTGLGQQPLATAGGFSTADIREGSVPNLSVGAASIPSVKLDTQHAPAPTAVSPFSTTSTTSSGSYQSPKVGISGSSGSTPSMSASSHSTSPDITASSGLSGRRTGPAFAEQQKPRKKTQAELDEELRMRMEDMAGEGARAGWSMRMASRWL
ncbi:hypothetical protein B0T20DRAFT_116130 [Sordaria brevicollis]|uniref:Uncharacterized protein n=1 Tax=Sordaria brevicollis TaxID=83679 RepID=A0AAE0PKI7_SORBR|nr:hypothetical protein B0T20DRAFT_116130 [Sordaria brevicollis]